MRKNFSLLALVGSLSVATIFSAGSFSRAAAPSPGPSGYRVIKTVPISGEGGWDYVTVDTDARRVYISHATQVVVLDADTYAEVGSIPDTQGVHGIAIASDLGRGFTSNGRTNTATIFDLKTLKTIGTVKTGTNPDAIIYVNIEDTSELVHLDAKDLKVLHRWPEKPCQEASGLAADMKNHRLFAGCDNKMMAVIDADSGEVVATLPIGEGV